MKHKSAIAILLTAAILSTAGLASAQRPAPVKKPVAAAVQRGAFQSLSRAEMELILADVAASNPGVIKLLATDPEVRKQQVDNLRQLLSFASEAERTGLAAKPLNKHELENIRSEVTAINYDRELNKADKSAPPFSSITDDRIAQFWTKGAAQHEAAFKDFLDTKTQLLRAADSSMKEIADQEKEEARQFFAKIQISRNDYDAKLLAGTLPKTFRDRVQVQVKLQQAQFLARAYADVMAGAATVSDAEVAAYISTHAEFDTTAKKAEAEKILKRAKVGEDFAKLANEFTEDPGNKGSDGAAQGGLYKDVPKGMMIAAFEEAALALRPGEVADHLVETDFGYHIIKLEKAPGVAPAAETYDVRHILIGTMYKDPDNPDARPIPAATFVRTRLTNEKEGRLVQEIVERNKVTVAEDFTIPGAPVKATAPKTEAPAKTKKPAARRTTRKS
jgi:parvulin-like peptidyl-prolyl isomerase